MNPVSLPALATTFVVSGALVGLPSLSVLVLYAVKVLHDRLAAAPSGLPIGPNPDALMWMLAGMVKAISLLARLLDFIFGVLAIGAAFGFVLGLALWLTGRGLQGNAPWARISAGVLLVLTMLPSLLLALSLHGTGRGLTMAMVIGCGLGLHALWVSPTAQTP
jgi:hypothetical protein